MSKKNHKNLNDINGWLIIDKPKNITSMKVVNKIKYLLKPKKIGHGGTLDPLASGILPIALGEATKTVSFIMDGIKTYDFCVNWGSQTTTDDIEGDVLFESSTKPTLENIENELPNFIGKINQTPPDYSAIKLNGKRSYDLARNNQPIKHKAREIEIFDLKIISQNCDNSTSFVAKTSKGAYIRALARDIGKNLGTFGHIASIRRTKLKPFSMDDAINVNSFEEMINQIGLLKTLDEKLISVMDALDDIPGITLKLDDAIKLKQGRRLLLPSNLDFAEDQLIYTKTDEILVAICQISKREIIPKRVFNFL